MRSVRHARPNERRTPPHAVAVRWRHDRGAGGTISSLKDSCAKWGRAHNQGKKRCACAAERTRLQSNLGWHAQNRWISACRNGSRRG